MNERLQALRAAAFRQQQRAAGRPACRHCKSTDVPDVAALKPAPYCRRCWRAARHFWSHPPVDPDAVDAFLATPPQFRLRPLERRDDGGVSPSYVNVTGRTTLRQSYRDGQRVYVLRVRGFDGVERELGVFASVREGQLAYVEIATQSTAQNRYSRRTKIGW